MKLEEAFAKLDIEPLNQLCIEEFMQAAKRKKSTLSELVFELAMALQGWDEPPLPKRENFRSAVPLPQGLSIDSLEKAMEFTQRMLFLVNAQSLWLTNLKLTGIIQTNSFSGLLSNVLTEGLSRYSEFRRYSDQRHPDLINPSTGEGLEVKATVNPNKGGEGHNGLGGWHLVASYGFDSVGNAIFSSVKIARLEPYREDLPEEKSDWKYLGSKLNRKTGTRRTETFVTTNRGMWKLRHGTVYIDPHLWPNWRRRLNPPDGLEIPTYSPWYRNIPTEEGPLGF